MHDDDPPLVFRTLAAEKLAIDKTGYVNFTDMTGIGVYAGEQRGIPMGVDGYAAPEQYSGEHVPQSDIYSIGALLHYLLTGHDPRRAKRFSFVDRPVRHLNPKVSKDLDMIVYKALAFEPKYRFKTVREMQDALNAL
jgi:serine/threonine protein kinase